MNLVLTVCVGNICRSPMAEAIIRAAIPDLQVYSAGVGALIGHKADSIAVELMKRRGLDISSHIAQQINQMMCSKADLILVMDNEQKKYIESRYPFSRGKVFRVADSVKQDVPDPYRMGEKAFEEALSIIDLGLATWIMRIKKIVEKS